VYQAAPVGFITCFLIGMTNGALWVLAPVYAQEHTQSVAAIGVFMATIVLGGALAQWPIGKLSDFVDRRWVIFGSGLTAAAFGGGLAAINPASEFKLLMLAFGFGGAALPLYSLCIAHVNDKMNADVFVEVSGQLLLITGFGAIIGPLFASFCMNFMGSLTLFVYTAIIHALVACHALWRIGKVGAVPRAEQVPYSAVPNTTPIVFEMQSTSTTDDQAHLVSK
jgi:MFS family permease